ncbi:MAG: TonB-dependent receptor [Prevotella sp.]|nr:TonB-dependent receptor [Prevotella sp.]
MQKRLLIMVALLLTMVLGAVAQVTTSSMAGKVTVENSDEAVIGATILAVHEPSGTRYTAVTNVNGLFAIQGMRTGGPYAVTVSYIGLETKTLKGITLQLGETYNLSVWLSENSNSLTEVVVTGKASKFAAEKTGASTNINNEQMMSMPMISRSITDIAKLSPYAGGGMSFAGANGKMSNFTVDGANFNNNFGLNDGLPAGGSPISLDAIEEVQVVIAPYDVRQTNFIGGGVNAITKSGTNTFKGTAYTYFRNEHMRGNKINGQDLGARAEDRKNVYGFTLGGPIIKNKLFFFANYEYEKTPGQVIKYRASQPGEEATGMVSRALAGDMERVHNYLLNNFGYETGSWTSFPADSKNEKLLARIDWNITDNHHLAVRYNSTNDVSYTGASRSTGDYIYGGSGDYRVGNKAMIFANTMYGSEKKVQSVSVDLNSRFGQKASNQLLYTYSYMSDPKRTSTSAPFPFIDISWPYDATATSPSIEPYISAGYELFSWKNHVENKVHTLTDNFTLYLGVHKLTAGFSFEHQFADNSYIREGTGQYRFRSIDEFLAGAAPEAVNFTYGFNGNDSPTSAVRFNQIGLYLQDEWNIVPNFKLSYGVRFDDLVFDEQDVERNTAIYDLDFNGYHIDTGIWPDNHIQISPRVGFTWDVFGDKSLKVRGGTGIFTGRLPLVFFTNQPGNANINKTTYNAGFNYKTQQWADANGHNSDWVEAKLAGLAGQFLNVHELMDYFEVPTTNENHVAGSKISGVYSDFKMPQVWKSSIAVDYQLPVSFPLTITGEFIYNKNINAVYMRNIDIKDAESDSWERFNGADNRLIYPSNYRYYNKQGAIMLDNTSKGYGYTANVTVNAEPLPNLNIMAAYTRTENKEVSGLPGSDPVSAWQNVISVSGPNQNTAQRSYYVTPDQVTASVGYYLPVKVKGLTWGTHLNLFYKGYSYTGTSFMYSNDMNGDGLQYDLIYIPANDSEIKFKTEADRVAFWQFVEQDDYLRTHKGQYAEAYCGRAPWLHRFDLRVAEDFEVKVAGTKQKFQASLDILNFGNLLNSHWGIPKNDAVSNYGKILKYEGVDAQNTPIFSMYKVNGKYPTKTYDTVMSYSNCWSMQIGLKYFFN